jgi:hypothetical protein
LKWRCDRGHEWLSEPSTRSGQGTGCPYCSGHRAIVGETDLATTHPELAAEAVGWDPTTLTAGSNKKVGWKCSKGHRWMSTVANRSVGNGCPVCSGRKIIAGLNDLATVNPELAAQADGWDPTTVSAGSHAKVRWRCQHGHTWDASIKNRSKGQGCAVCSGRKTMAGLNDLATVNPELAAQADGWDPTTVSAGSGRKVRWKCAHGHTWDASVGIRSRGHGCPVCSGHTALAGLNDLATTHPELAAQADGWDPTTVSAGSGRKVRWRCQHGHTWDAPVSNRSRGHGCPVCSGLTALAGLNDLATTHPELAAQADGWDPTTLSAGSNKKMGWKCQNGHTWFAGVDSRKRGRGCPVCSNKSVLVGFNDLATTNPELAAQADDWDPTTLSISSGNRRNWVCRFGHRWSAVVASRSSGVGCPVCSGASVLIGFNDLATTHPELAAQADGWDPTTVNRGSDKKVGWKCEAQHKWKATIGSRSRGNGCPTCAQSGFDPNSEGWLYLIDNDVLDMFQIGISNFPVDRIRKHARNNWEVMEVRGPMEGHLAQQLETAILHAAERRGAVLGHKAHIEKFDGYSEAWTKESLKVASIKQLLGWVYEDESQ